MSYQFKYGIFRKYSRILTPGSDILYKKCILPEGLNIHHTTHSGESSQIISKPVSVQSGFL